MVSSLTASVAPGGDRALEHRAVNACLCPLYAVEGCHVVTVEGECCPKKRHQQVRVPCRRSHHRLVRHRTVRQGSCHGIGRLPVRHWADALLIPSSEHVSQLPDCRRSLDAGPRRAAHKTASVPRLQASAAGGRGFTRCRSASPAPTAVSVDSARQVLRALCFTTMWASGTITCPRLCQASCWEVDDRAADWGLGYLRAPWMPIDTFRPPLAKLAHCGATRTGRAGA